MSEAISDLELRAAGAFQHLHWLAAGRIDSQRLTRLHLDAIERSPLNAFTALDPSALQQAAASDARRRAGQAIGRLDGLTVAIKDSLDVAGLPTSVGLPGRRERAATDDAAVVARLRAAGAVILGKTNLDEGTLGTMSVNPHFGDVHNPWGRDFTAGGSSGGSAAAVAAGLCSFAMGSDTMGSIRIPASHCGVYGLKPTHGQLSAVGLARAARRLDCVGVLARAVADIAIVLQVLDGHDPVDARSRRRRVPLCIPDWEPGSLRSGILSNLAALGVCAEVEEIFLRALVSLGQLLGERRAVDFADQDLSRTRRAALLVMESELALEFAADLADEGEPLSPRLRAMLEYARGKSAPDYVAADRLLDVAVVRARQLFADLDVLVLPSVPWGPYPLSERERAGDAELTAFASLAGFPALSLPMGRLADGLPIGLQFVAKPGAELCLLDLAEICAATLDAAPAYPATP